jgi:CHAT domain-containing protein
LAINGKDTSLHALEVSEQDAKTLGIEPGPLTAGSIREVLIREDRRGVVQLLALPQGDDQLQPKLAALWRALIPEPHRSQLAASEFNRLVVVPDGALALMPFEALVVSDGEEPTYLLDVGPPTIYGPSATVLYQLAEARTDRVETSIEPVLTLGNPTYPATTDESSPLRQLAPLVFSGTESDWVSQVFQKQGIKSQQLVAGQATEAQLTQQVKGRKVIHLACHGFAEQSLGNFFGALALTPGGKNGDSEPHDDGFLTLAEIYEMNLNDCELAILSACETNTGEQQRGEGVWSLSRGFLVAGARRVVASNWLVDDRAAASLVSYFCSSIASQEASGEKVDYAEALHKAKRWSRRQEKWKSPFFWSTFVLVGPS